MEQLEQRTLLAVVAWDGGGGDSNWHNPINWSTDTVPAAADDVQIGSAFANITVMSVSDVTVNSVTSEAILAISGGTLSIAANSTVNVLDVSLGTVDVQSGAFSVYGGTSIGGTFLVADASPTVDGNTILSLANYSLDAGSTVRGQGHMTLAGLTTVNGSYSIGHGTSIPRFSDIDFSGAQPGLELGQSVYVDVSPNETKLRLGAHQVEVQTLTLFGTIFGSGEVTVTGLLDWSAGGALRGSGALHVPASGLIDMHGGFQGGFQGVDKVLDGWTIHNAGTATYRLDAGLSEFSNHLLLSNGAVIDNSGTWNILDGRSVRYTGQGALPQIENSGTIRLYASGSSTSIEVTLLNTGTVDVQSGTFVLTSFTQTLAQFS